MTPAVRMLMREHGLCSVQIVGTGHSGRITREDVMKFVERGRTAAAAGHGGSRHARWRHAAWSRDCGCPGRRVTVGLSGTRCRSRESFAGPGTVGPLGPVAVASAVAWEPGQDEVLVPHTQMRRRSPRR